VSARHAFIHAGIDSLELEVLKRINKHTHDSEAAKVQATVVINRLENRAAETMEPTTTVINECISGLSEAAKVNSILSISIFQYIDKNKKSIIKKMYLFIYLF